MAELVDKAGRTLWDNWWEGRSIPTPIDPRPFTPGNYVNRRFHQFFRRSFRGLATPGKELLEIGCGRSRFLPYFAREFGFRITGLDYSELGCTQSREILDRAGVPGRIVCGDLRTPPEDLVEAFDVVVSFGVVEHFEDTAGCLAALARFVKPGGLLLTTIPNMTGLVGWLQRYLARPIYDIHVPLSRADLAQANVRAGCTVEACEYFMGLNLGVVNLSSWSSQRLCWLGTAALVGVSRLTFLFGLVGLRLPGNRWTSPYVVCAARKPTPT